ncbi:Thermostable beta-glucosidase B [Cytospora mali]|uniref:beta-glucosidase n=1 Tax=Cytospora mali TaxID=578113 RepID=A0A194VF47_CYTMA|nr:Thermostable beta-glucosidase B [Valsa mali var. pyri (nom. inval.)]
MSQEDRIEALLRALTLEEKCFLVAGKNMWETCDVDRLGIRSLKTTDGPAGVRGATWIDGTHTTFIPCGISLAATFDPALIERVGDILGAETRSKNSNVLLAPTMNISRSPLGGRNFENFGEDPYLSGIMATSYIKGVQKHGVGACMKHYVANDMETRRFNMNQQIDERTLREIYLKPFQMTLAAQPWTAMAAYPKINGHHADCSTFLLQDILKKEWGFDGLVMSDWGGTNDTVESILAGTDLEMPGPPIRYGKALVEAVKAGKVSEKDHLNASVMRLLRLLERAGLLDPERKQADQELDSDLPEFRQTAREAASGGIVLLKNSGILPLMPQKIKKLAIIGPNAKTPTTGGTGSAALRIDEQALFDEAVAVATEAEIVVLVVGHNNDTEKEGIDRTSLSLPRRTNELVEAICRANANTVVVTQSASAIAMPWAGAPPAIVHAWYQGQENGNALADVLLGHVSPSGKLPVTFPSRLEDHGSHSWFPGDAERDYAEYGEGVLVGYRWFDAKNIQPLWTFGFGLSYTAFRVTDAKVSGTINLDGSAKAIISATVTNTGAHDGAEVVQVYVAPSPVIAQKGRDAPPRSLVGFYKVFVRKGKSELVRISLDVSAVSWFDVEAKGGPSSSGRWRADDGKYKCFLGTSSRDIVAEVEVVVE